MFVGADWMGSQMVKDYAANSPERDRIHFVGFVEDRFFAGILQVGIPLCISISV